MSMTEPLTCSRCGEEVRYGWRAGRTSIEQQRIPQPPAGFWMHRDPDADHAVVLGQASWMTDWSAVAEQRAVYAAGGPVEPEGEAPDVEVLDEDGEVVKPIVEKPERTWDIPPPEVTATPIDIGDPRLPQGAKDKINLARTNGWRVTAHYSRAARVHASHGNLLSVSDFVVMRCALDGTDKIAVASWTD